MILRRDRHRRLGRAIKSSRGVYQEDPISSYLFIRIYQNLTAILNLTGKIPGFNNQLKYNFNHLMYTDDLILISQASRKTTRYIKLYLAIYGTIYGQIPNDSK